MSAYDEKDDLDFSMDPGLFAYDRDVRISDEEVEAFVYRGFVSR